MWELSHPLMGLLWGIGSHRRDTAGAVLGALIGGATRRSARTRPSWRTVNTATCDGTGAGRKTGASVLTAPSSGTSGASLGSTQTRAGIYKDGPQPREM